MESNYEKEMNKRNEKIPYEKEMNKRNEKIPYEKEMNKEMKRSQILRIVLGGQLLISTLKLFWEGGGEGGGCFSFGGTVQCIEESNIYLCFVVCRLKREDWLLDRICESKRTAGIV